MSDNMELTKLTEKPKLLLQNHLRISLKKKNQKKGIDLYSPNNYLNYINYSTYSSIDFIWFNHWYTITGIKYLDQT